MVDSLEELKSSRSASGKNFPNFVMLDAKIASALNKIIQNYQFKRRSVSRNRKRRKRTGFYEEDRSLSTTTFELLSLMIQYWIALICSLLLFMTIIFRNSTQGGMKFYYLCQRFRPMMFWKVCTI